MELPRTHQDPARTLTPTSLSSLRLPKPFQDLPIPTPRASQMYRADTCYSELLFSSYLAVLRELVDTLFCIPSPYQMTHEVNDIH